MSQESTVSTESTEENQSTKATPETVSVKKEILSWLLVVVIAFAGAMLLQNFVIVNAVIPTSSMLSTIQEGDRVVASRLSYLTSEPERGDVIIFHYPDDESIPYVKRIIGLPGDTVTILDGEVYLNGSIEPLDEPYLTEPRTGNYGPYVVPSDGYFMLGDNRDNSKDSRFWDNTYVTSDQIMGKVLFRYFPTPSWFEQPTYETE